jgi:hypothetical protein
MGPGDVTAVTVLQQQVAVGKITAPESLPVIYLRKNQ